jgi:hypothetical protein
MMDRDCFLFISFYTEDVRVGFNSLEGSIPEEIFNVRNMSVVWAYSNNLNGTLSTSIGQMVHLQDLDIAYNYLTGTIPSQLGQLTKLREFFMFSATCRNLSVYMVCF